MLDKINITKRERKNFDFKTLLSKKTLVFKQRPSKTSYSTIRRIRINHAGLVSDPVYNWGVLCDFPSNKRNLNPFRKKLNMNFSLSINCLIHKPITTIIEIFIEFLKSLIFNCIFSKAPSHNVIFTLFVNFFF